MNAWLSTDTAKFDSGNEIIFERGDIGTCVL
jgi:hypothetical protein